MGSKLTSAVSEYSRLIEGYHELFGLAIASLLFGAALILWFKKGNDKKKARLEKESSETWASAAAKISVKEVPISDAKEGNDDDGQTKGDDNDGDGKLRNVFSVKQKPIVHASGGEEAAASDRPFESSYYHAHNKHSTGGGYKDGLRAEDYDMNGPKLLSKGGVSVDDKSKKDAAKVDSQEENMQPKGKDTKERPKPKLTASTPITKYMWDDDGKGNVSKIHIDSLPISSTKTMKWDTAGILKDQVEVRLIGENNEGLYIGVTHEGKRYHLHVPRLYGEAEAVKSIVKKHKLLVKITKKQVPKRYLPKKYSDRHKPEEGAWKAATKLIGNLAGGGEAKEECVSLAWPRLSASSGGGLGGGTTQIDEKMFKQMDLKQGGNDDFGTQFGLGEEFGNAK